MFGGYLPQSAFFDQEVFCTGLGPPGFCSRVRRVRLSALQQPKTPGRSGDGFANRLGEISDMFNLV